jgi:hypothetical protein
MIALYIAVALYGSVAIITGLHAYTAKHKSRLYSAIVGTFWLVCLVLELLGKAMIKWVERSRK